MRRRCCKKGRFPIGKNEFVFSYREASLLYTNVLSVSFAQRF